MIKKYILTFSISVLLFFSISIIMLMIMVPQQESSLTTSVQNYDVINSTDYQFVQTKDINEDFLVKEYTITTADLATFKKYNQYATGNSDPFTPSSDLADTSNNNTTTNTNNNTTNSNGGISNPSTTNK
ncbi:MAG: hypothetical protein PHD15_00745 [Clostridia bacterium]|nr:hypothetical protein [Clostridia bacterium]MDD4386278.1 hypothetical protein [Clostridia bacterium]